MGAKKNVRIPLVRINTRGHGQRWWLGRVGEQVVLWDQYKGTVLDFSARQIKFRIDITFEAIIVRDDDGTEYEFDPSDKAVACVEAFIEECVLLNPAATASVTHGNGMTYITVGIVVCLIGAGLLVLFRDDDDGFLIGPVVLLIGIVAMFHGAAELGRASSQKRRWEKKQARRKAAADDADEE